LGFDDAHVQSAASISEGGAETVTEMSDLSMGTSLIQDKSLRKASVVFSDNFDDNAIDTSKWRVSGNTVTETNGQLRLSQDVTDDGGYVICRVDIDPTKPIVISKKAYVHYSNEYRYGGIGISFYDPEDEVSASTFHVENISVGHMNENYCEQHGFVPAYRNDALQPPNPCWTTVWGTPASGIWDTWFDERIVLDLQAGRLDLYLDDVLVTTFLQEVSEEFRVTTEIYVLMSPYGWGTGHYEIMDDFVISQPGAKDTTAPIGAIAIDIGATYALGRDVNLALSATDGINGSGVTEMRLSNDGTNWNEWEDYGTSKAWTLTAGDGNKTVYAQFRDALGHVSASVSDTITLDMTPPDVTLSSGVGAYTNAAFTVTATFTETVTGFVQGDVTFTNATISAFSNNGLTYQWTVTPTDDGTVAVSLGAGTCTDLAGNANTTSNQISMIFDETPPAGTVTVNEGESFTESTSVNLALSAGDAGSGMAEMRFSNNGTSWSNWESYGTSKAWTLATGDGVKTVSVQFRDNAGNVSQAATDTITLDTTAPTGSVSINGGVAYANSRNATLTLSASDGSGSGVGQMRISNDGTNWNEWEDYETSKAWTLTAGDGTKAVYAQFRDALNNTSAAFTDTIVLDMTAPGVTAQQVSTHMNTARSITLAGTDAGSAPVAYSVTVSPTHGTLSGTAPALSYMPDDYYVGGDEFTFQVTDGAGNPNTAVVTISVTNTAPVAADKEVSTLMNSPVSIALGVSDANGDAITSCDVVDGPSHGTLSGTGTNRTYTPDAGYHGSDGFTFRACDGQADSNVATVSIDVIPTGSLTVTITPDAAVARGGQWCVDGGPWRVSGTTVSGLPVGEHVVTFYAIPKLTKSGCETPKNYDTPASRTVTIVVGETLEITETYQQSTQSTTAGVSGLTGDSIILVGVIAALFASRLCRRSYRAGSQRTL